VTDSGIRIEVIPLPVNAQLPISIKVEGNFTLVNIEQHLNEHIPIEVTPSGISIDLMLLL
jgi:hypothetical protein